MSSLTDSNSPLAEKLKATVQQKALEMGWTEDSDDTSLSEYIILLLANGKSRDEIANELSTELIPGAEGIEEFSTWLSGTVAKLTGTNAGDKPAQAQQPQEQAPIPAAYETDLGESAPDNAPKGPKSQSISSRGSRGGRGGTPVRASFDAALHRTRGNDRINSHTRGAPKGPKQMNGKPSPGMQKALNGLQSPPMQNPMMPGSQPGQFNPISPQQQLEFMAMMEQQARMLAQFMPNMMPPGMNGSLPQNSQNGQSGQNGRSMFDRVERGRGASRGRGARGGSQNGSRKPSEATVEGEGQMIPDAMEGTDATNAATVQPAGPKDPSSTVCYFNLRCLNKECLYAHQSPSAPPGTEIDMSQTCSFGAACKNAQCHGKHPSPAMITAHKAEQECKFFPNCTNPNCPFKHPTMPLCQFGASCKNEDCKFTHLKTKCKFNPCTNARCPFAHEPGQNRNMSSFSWSKDQAEQASQATQGADDQSHVSTRRFVTEGEEEFIKPEAEEHGEEAKEEEQEMGSADQAQQADALVT
ncbi:hypothetical protein LTR05_008281 [Lithohypha guttulata]|uniref:Nab2-like CCCH zinc finger domain-containing protein n=1 Tax=Lithohypha guttulata TaxID=1690604 RepID=A0AAN7Y3M6_9EURO|nr:hypothetical protein LTR05_008281 [Lithohypha guttulata]